jgi:hypothetical protein
MDSIALIWTSIGKRRERDILISDVIDVIVLSAMAS